MNFYVGYCMIVDHDTSKLKGIGECRNGLYYLMNDDMKHIVSNLSNLTTPTGLNAAKTLVSVTHRWLEADKPNEIMLWHLRLGHAPIQKLSIIGLNIKPNLKSQTQTICSTCPMAKLTKLPFPES